MVDEPIVGNSPPRRESFLKVTGQAGYTEDLIVPGMAYGKIVRSPYANAKVKSIDVEAALKVPGVLGILRPEDVPQKKFNCAGCPPSSLLIKDEQILTNRPRHVGDRIAAIVAETKYDCERALQKIKVEYDVLPAVFTAKKALAADAPLIHPLTTSQNIFKTITASQGDVDQGLIQSDLVFEDEFTLSAVQHVALEPIACICHFIGEDSLTIWATTQTPFQERRVLAEILDLPENRIRVIKPIMGGGFGARQQIHNTHIGALLSKLVNRPVKIVNTREEELYASSVRHEVITKLKIGVNRSGLLQAFDAELFFNAGAYSSQSPVVAAAASRKLQYRVPHYRYQGHCVLTNAPVAAAMRGYGNPQLNFAREIMMDRIARELKMNPVEFRLLNHIKVGEKFPAAVDTIQSCAIEDCVLGANRIKTEIDDSVDHLSKKPDDGVNKAWGVAFGCHTSGPSSNEGMSACMMIANDDGTVQLMTGSADIGQGSETTLSQVAADVLGIELFDVGVTAADTRHTPYDTGTFASSQMYVGGNAVKKAAEDLLSRLKTALVEKYEIIEDQITWRNHRFEISLKGTTCYLNFKAAIQEVTFHQKGAVLMGSSSFKAGVSPPPFAVCWAQVAFDKKANCIKVLHVIEAVDVGTAVNPKIVSGQVEGGIAMGVGYAMMEQIEINHRCQKPVTSDLLHYRTPLATDMPKTHVYIAKSYEPTGPLGAKSVGELATVPVAAAIANAIANATGEPVNQLPFSRQVIPANYRLFSGTNRTETMEVGNAD
jgi:CO/xanthine dehydrogenase Mo-binding subunit